MKETDVKLQVLICTFGQDGILRIAEGVHPRINGVEYIVSWQLPDSEVHPEVPEELKRPDFKISIIHSKGLSKNRNHAISLATAPYCLISDDDIDYSEAGLKAVIDTFESNPDLDIATFKYDGSDNKRYPSESFDLNHPPKGYFYSSIEIAFRLKSVKKAGIFFDERFGIGAKYPSGEEDVWISSLLRKELNGRFFPLTIESHKDDSTGFRTKDTPVFIRTKGATMQILFPFTWFPRMITHLLRYKPRPGGMTRLGYIRAWLSGAFSTSLWIIPPAIVMITVFILSMISYWQEDAVAFSYFMPAADNDHSYIPFNSIWEIPASMANHYVHGTGRVISHGVAQFFCAFAGQTIFALCNSLMWGVFIILLTRLAKVSLQKPVNTLLASVLTFLLFFAFGSEHTFPFEPPHQIDYVWVGALTIFWLQLFFRTNKENSILKLVLLAILSLICGEANEAFSIPIGGGLLVYLLISRFKITRRQWIMGVAYGIGAIICIAAPGNYERLQTGEGSFSILHTIENLLPSLIIPVIGLSSIIIARKRIRNRQASKQRYALFIASVIIINYLLGIAVGMGSGSRIVTCANMLICAVIIHLWGGKTLKPIATISLSLIFLTLVALRVSAINTLSHKNRLIVESYGNSISGIVVIPDSLFLYEVRKSIARPLPYMKRERIHSPHKPDLRIRPRSMLKLPLDKDTNMVIQVAPQAWLMLRSKKYPADFIISKILLPCLINHPMTDRTLDWDKMTTDICFDSTENWKAGIYVNDRPYINADIIMKSPKK